VVPRLHRGRFCLPYVRPFPQNDPVIDLHLHTTASDGTCTPEDLVRRAWQAGIRTMSVTDHDTMAAIGPATAAARLYGMTVIPGIEITAVHRGKDVHVLAYGLRETVPALQAQLAAQRDARRERAAEIGKRLAALGVPIDMSRLLTGATGKALARPAIARALVDAGHVSSVADAFARYLDDGGPAYVPHTGASPASVVAIVAAAGGISSLAHPAYSKADDLIPELVDAGLAAVEAFHSSQNGEDEQRYLALAERHGIGVSGGSDYHGEGTRRAEWFGVTNLPEAHFDRLMERAAAI
jgi:3',5'-nucleoside bisphosphate phosphatase